MRLRIRPSQRSFHLFCSAQSPLNSEHNTQFSTSLTHILHYRWHRSLHPLPAVNRFCSDAYIYPAAQVDTQVLNFNFSNPQPNLRDHKLAMLSFSIAAAPRTYK